MDNKLQPALTRLSVQQVVHIPSIAWPTIVLAMVSISLHTLTTYLFFTKVLSIYQVITVNTICSFLAFTPMHDACHGSIATVKSGVRWLNDFIGTLCACVFPAPYAAFKYCHLQHHKHTNDPKHDPDHYVAQGPTLLLPLKWISIECKYYYIYLPLLLSRPLLESTSTVIQLVLSVLTLLYSYRIDCMYVAVYAWLIPGRLALGLLAYSFDYLPHRPHRYCTYMDANTFLYVYIHCV